MKRFLSLILCAALLLSCCPIIPLQASAATSGYYTYTVSNGEATITACDTTISGDVTLPSTLGGYPVTAIGDKAFYRCENLVSVIISKNVICIGYEAFGFCVDLTAVTIPGSVSSIGDMAFSRCDSLAEVYIEDVAAWCNISFGDNFSNPLYEAGKLYLNGELVTDLVIPNGLTSIGHDAFQCCTSLESVVIPEGVINIGYGAFYGCTNLISVTIPNTVTSIGNYAFESCTSLKSIVIPEGVTRIGTYVFASCNKLTSITIPMSLTSIENCAFYDCYWLTQVHIKDIAAWCNISFNGAINGHPMYYATELYLNGELVTDLVIPAGVSRISDLAFYSCESLNSVTIGNSVINIGHSAFSNCVNLTSATIGTCVASIGANAFNNCKKLTSISIPASVTSIGTGAFYCQEMTGIWVHEDNAYYSSDSVGVLFNKDKTQLIQAPVALSGSYTVPNNVQSIESYAFEYCRGLTGVSIPAGVSVINDYAFFQCSGLQNINIPNSVNSIGPSAFGKCSNLQSFIVPDGVSGIGGQTFWDCTNLKEITIPVSVKSIDTYAFYGCDNLKNVYYKGTQAQWNKISIGSSNTQLTNATLHIVEPTFTGFNIQTLPTKTEYWVGEMLDTTGLKLTAQYSDGSTAEITEGYTVSGFDSATAGIKKVTVTYEEKTATFDVTVKAYGIFDSNGKGYETLTAAIESVAQGSKLTITQDVTENVTVNKTVILDLNGFSINGTITVKDGCILYGMDSQTDDYTINDGKGYGKVTGAVSGVQAQDGYMLITEEDGISFHRVDLQLNTMTLRAAEAGIYFKSNFAGDELVAENVQQFGVALSVQGIPTADNLETDCKYSKFTGFKAGVQDEDTTSTLLKGVMKAENASLINYRNANMPIYGRAYILTNDGQYIFGTVASRTFKQQVEAIDTKWSDLSATQQTALVQMYEQFVRIMGSWNLPNLKEHIA